MALLLAPATYRTIGNSCYITAVIRVRQCRRWSTVDGAADRARRRRGPAHRPRRRGRGDDARRGRRGRVDDRRADALLRRQARVAAVHASAPRWPSATPTRRGPRPASGREEALLRSLEGALPLDDERSAPLDGDRGLLRAGGRRRGAVRAQRDAYREFRDGLADLLQASDDGRGDDRDACLGRAEQLIAVADGIAVQALFDPESWPPARQLSTLHATVGPMLAR